jgi:O-antigen/teichoic acid export membrane protein
MCDRVIAASSVISSTVPTVISYFLAPYRPRLSLAKFADFSSFLGWFSCSQIVAAINYQIDRVMLGSFVSKADLGRYTMAGDLAVLPTQSFVGPAMQPLMAAFSSIIDDQERVRSAYLKASRFTMMMVLPICVGMSLTADLAVSVLLGPQWSQTAVYLRWLALATALSAYIQPLYSLALALNRPKVIFQINLVDLVMRSILIGAGLYWFSLMGAVAARGAVSVIMFIVTLVVAKEVAGIRILRELGNLWRPALACAVMAAVVHLLRMKVDLAISNPVLELGLVGAVGAATYAAALLAAGFRFKL